MLPGMHAMAVTPFGQIWPDIDLPDLNILMSQFFSSPVSVAVLKVRCYHMLRPAVLCCAVLCVHVL